MGNARNPEPRWRRWWSAYWRLRPYSMGLNVRDFLFYGPIYIATGFVIGWWRHDTTFARAMPAFWFGACLFATPFIIWYAGRPDLSEGIPARRTLSAMAVSLAPGPFFLPFGPLNDFPLIWASLSAYLGWSSVAHYFAFNRLLRAVRARRLLLGLGAVACLAAAGRAARLLILFQPASRDPVFLQQVAWALSTLSLAATVFYGWQGVRLARHAIADDCL